MKDKIAADQLTVNAVNAAAENFRTFNRTFVSVTEFNTSGVIPRSTTRIIAAQTIIF